VRTLSWHAPPDGAVLQAHWLTWFPPLAVARVGLVETLTALQAQGNGLWETIQSMVSLGRQRLGSGLYG
jgi:hypothetical protein